VAFAFGKKTIEAIALNPKELLQKPREKEKDKRSCTKSFESVFRL